MILALYPVLTFETRHLNTINNDQKNEDINRAVLRHPEPQRRAPDRKVIKRVPEQNPGTKGHDEPNKQQGKSAASSPANKVRGS